MKKYLLCLMLVVGAIMVNANGVFAEAVSTESVSTESVLTKSIIPAESIVQNFITNSQVQQYILINCRESECLALVEALKKINQLNSGAEAEAPMAGSSSVPVEKLNLDADLDIDKGSPLPKEEISSTVVIVNQPAVDAVNVATGVVGENNIVEQHETAPPVQAETNSAVNMENENKTAGTTLVANKTKVSAKQIRISEVFPAPLAGQKEWIELYNSLDFPVDLSDWQLVEGAGKITKLAGVVNANNFIVFEKDSLNNSGDIIILKDAAGSIIDSVSYGDWDDGNLSDNAPKPANGQSLILSEGNYLVSATPTPNLPNILPPKKTTGDVQEPGATALMVQTADAVSPIVNVQPPAPTVSAPSAMASTVNPIKTEEPAASAPAPAVLAEPAEASAVNAVKIETSATAALTYQFSDKIFINEFLADPIGSDDEEWIELFNDGLEPVNLLGWSLDDAEGGSQLYIIKEPTVIGAKDFLVFKKEKTGLILNNSTDSVVLRNPAGKEISRFDYKNPKEGFSFAKFSDGWQETSILTPGAVNQKSTLQVAQYAASTAGKLVSAKKQSSTNKNVSSEESTAPLKITAADINSKLAGKLVQLNGTLVEKKAKKLILADESGEFIVFIKSGVKIDLKLYELTNRLEVRGVIGDYNGELRLLPRSKEDIVNLSLQKLDLPSESAPINTISDNGQKKTFAALLILFVAIIAVNAYLAIVHRRAVVEKIDETVKRFMRLLRPDARSGARNDERHRHCEESDDEAIPK